ncbi:MAG TPA: hypothetical protein DDZ51_00465 [Planctomycetaceae bacterium]|nr:hypothetical protein [Planctomycetaceae bacterium]
MSTNQAVVTQHHEALRNAPWRAGVVPICSRAAYPDIAFAGWLTRFLVSVPQPINICGSLP